MSIFSPSSGFPKIVTPNSFEWGPFVETLSTIVDDPQVFRKVASSRVVHDWGTVSPIKNHTLIHIIALGDFEKIGCNRNGDAFEEWFNAKSHPTFIKHAKLYEGHRTCDPTDPSKDVSKGFVAKTAHNGDMGRVELLIAANHDKCAHWLSDFERGEPQCFSMGFNCYYDECSKCAFKAKKPEFYCEHVRKNASAPYGMGQILSDGSKCFVFNRAGFWNDISKVGIGADMTAFDLRKVAALAEASGRVLSGAELGEMFVRKEGEVSPRMRLARKLAEAEKQAARFGMPSFWGVYSTRTVPQKVARVLAEADSPADVYTYLSSKTILLPVREFFKVAMPLDAIGYKDDLEAVERKFLYDGPFAWADKEGLLPQICANQSYATKRASTISLNSAWESNLVRDFSMRKEFSRLRDPENAVKIACLMDGNLQNQQLTPKQAALACEYLAYRLSAIEGGGVADESRSLFL